MRQHRETAARAVREIRPEFERAGLGDRRLDERLAIIAAKLAGRPEMSFPRAAGNDSELEATYRFMNNPRATPDGILASHVRESVRRSRGVARLVVPHDTTEFNFGKTPRKDLARVGRGQSFGFYGHFALAVDGSNGSRRPLGVLGFVIQRRTGKTKGDRSGGVELQLDPTNERLRWLALVDQVESLLAESRPIHVMDREGDSYRLLAHLIRRGTRFVVRMNGVSRPVSSGEERVSDVMQRAPIIAKREVPISARRRSAMPTYRRTFPSRRGRTAKLHVSAGEVVIERPKSASRTPEPELKLNFVRVFEPKPPRGENAIEWRLWTTEPVTTAEEILAVVDDYRCRWRIEEYFKALKTGCRVESRQLETHRALVNALALLAPIAWRLLGLRTLGGEDSHLPASAVLTEAQLVCLRGALRKNNRPPLPPHPTARDAMLGVAALGGHLKRNGDPGWIVLGRGLDDLLKIELGFTIARKM
jgi:hypothetical protein